MDSALDSRGRSLGSQNIEMEEITYDMKNIERLDKEMKFG